MKKEKNIEAEIVNKKRKPKKLKRIIIIVVVGIFVLLLGSCFVSVNNARKAIESSGILNDYTEYAVDRRDITEDIKASANLSPLNEYNITTLLKGEIIEANFELGDLVNKDDILYKISTDDIDSLIEDAKTSLERAQENYDLNVKNYNKAVERQGRVQEDYDEALSDYNKAEVKYNNAVMKYEDLSVKATANGTVTNIYVNKGDKIMEGSKIAEVADLSTMLLEVPFHIDAASKDWVGKTATVEVVGSMEEIEGSVKRVSNATTVLEGNKLVRMVTIEVKNPGGITNTSKGIATIGNYTCSLEGSFSAGEVETLVSDKAGKISEVVMLNHSIVNKDEIVLMIDGSDEEELLSGYKAEFDAAKRTIDNAFATLENAKDNVENVQNMVKTSEQAIEDAKKYLKKQEDNLEDCYIKTPITGKIIKKNTLVGDIVGSNQMDNVMAVVYDLSALKFDMAVDELDIISLREGMEVEVNVDAVDSTFKGIISNISMISNSGNGVTNYPVTVRIDEIGNLLPGMNANGRILLDEAKDVLAVPNDAVMRGDVVYIKDTENLKSEDDVAPEGFRTIKVKTGATDGEYIEIIEGLNEGDIVYVKRNSDDTLSDLQIILGKKGTDRRNL